MNIHFINGPNLNLLGKREPEIYGDTTFESFLEACKQKYSFIQIEYYQSNVEGEIINYLQKVGFDSDGIVLNAGGYSHTSVAIADAIKSIAADVVEVHISNIYAREEFRQHSLLSRYCKGVISGFGLLSYELALKYFTERNQPK